MAKYSIYESNLCFYYKKIIDFERDYRNQIKDEMLLTAINMNLILCITCFLEGILEDRGHIILGYYNSVKNCVDLKEFEIRKAYNTINNQINEFFHIKISQTTGIANFDNIFEIFLGKSFINSKNINPLIEGINALFQLRNVIAHGRKVHAYELEAYYTKGIEEHFSGGYKKAEDYLTKKGLLHQKFVKTKNVEIFSRTPFQIIFMILSQIL